MSARLIRRALCINLGRIFAALRGRGATIHAIHVRGV